ncbi:MAG: aminotransferase class III-fold pyridoxal phosphate-dependent enzyme [Planctomycetaceae bacterium]|nr:aminotransferase class III-fold pyridoxal phosphate-dependent enzyme [Planctomycetaceae bacterium]
MLDLQYICDNADLVSENCRNRGVQANIPRIVELRQKRGEAIAQGDNLRHEQKDIAGQIPKEKDTGKKQALVAKGKELKEQVAASEENVRQLEQELRQELLQVPNLTHPDAPIGKDDTESKTVKTWGDIPKFDFQPLDHVALMEKHNLVDLEAGSRVAGHGFYYLKNEAALLELALIQYAVSKLVDDQTAAIMLEPVQGEGGINIPAPGFLEGLRKLADERGALLIFDEVQTCMGRLGTWFGYQSFNVQPDIMTMAKGVAGGVACGVIVAKESLAPDLRPGMHASTFGGNPLAMAAGIATVETIEQDNLLENVGKMSERYRQYFEKLASELSVIKEIRIRGMMVGVDLKITGTPAVGECMKRGVLINCTHDTVIRLLPALNITADQVDEGCAVIGEVLRNMAKSA